MTGIESASPGQKGPYGRPRSYDPDFHGPVHKRSCTDILCALLFFVFMIGWAGVGAYAIYYGDPEILAFPTDSDGRKCGRDPEVADKKFLLYFDLTQCSSPIVLIAGCPTPQVCVSQCPQENRFAVPYGLDERLCTDAARRSLTCRPGVNPMDRSRSCRSLLRDTDDCAPYTFRSAAVLGRCVPNLGIGDFDEDNDKVKDADGKEMNVTMDALYKGAEKLGVFVSLKDFGVEAVSDYRGGGAPSGPVRSADRPTERGGALAAADGATGAGQRPPAALGGAHRWHRWQHRQLIAGNKAPENAEIV